MRLMYALLWSSLALADQIEDTTTLIADHWNAIRDESRWQSPTVRERELLRDGIEQLVFASDQCPDAQIDQVRNLLGGAGFTVSRARAGAADLLIVEELPHRRRGGGLFVIRCGPATPLAVQAPHAFFDLRTRHIAWSLFAEGNLRMGMWSTVHRYRSHPEETREADIHPADVCHEYGSFFHAATVAASLGAPALRFVQLHGFTDGRTDHDVVISSGLSTHPPASFARRLGDRLGSAAVFGVNTRSLGGTRNVQGRFLASVRDDHFLHLELSAATRERLSDAREDRSTLLEALMGSWR